MRTLLVVLVGLLAGDAAAEIRGIVRDASGDPLPGVTLFTKGSQESVVTESDGRFILPASERATVVAFLGGFESREIEAVPGADLSIVLQLAAVAESLTVTARADREAPMSTYEQRPLDIVRTPGAAGDAFRALQTLPGVVKTDEGAGLFVRGGDVSETRVMLDGATLAHPYRYESPSGGQFGSVDAFLLSGVSFSTGGFSARYGNVLSAVVDLRGLGAPPRDAYTVTAGLAGLSGRGAWRGGEGQGFRASGNLRFPRLLFAVNGAPREFERYPGGWDLNGSAHYDSPRFGRFKIFAMEARTSIGVEIEQENFEGILDAETRADVIAAAWRHVAGGWQLTSSLGVDLYRNSTKAGVLDLDNDDRRLAWRADASRAFGSTIVRAGLDADLAEQGVHGRVPERGGDLSGASGSRLYDVDYRDSHAGLYVEGERSWGAFTLTAGVRGDVADRTGSWVDPRLNVTYGLGGNRQLRFAWGIYRQAPAAQYFDRVAGAARLDPMEAQQWIAGFEQGDPDQTLHLRLEAYEKRYESLPLQHPTRGYTSDGYGHARGLDLFLRRQWSRFELRASGSLLESRRRWTAHDQRLRFTTLPDDAWRTDFDIPLSGEVVGSFAATPRLTLGGALRAAAGKPYTPVIGARATPNGFEPLYGELNSGRMPSFQRIDLSASYRRVHDSGRAFVYFTSVTNALARRNAFSYHYSADFSQRYPVVSLAPRSFYAGVSMTR